MAKLDKSQGSTFAYTNLYELYKKTLEAENSQKSNIEVTSPLAVKRNVAPKREELRTKIANGDRSFAVPMSVREAEEKMERKAVPHTSDPLESLRRNIDKLGEAQAKLRFLIQELDTVTKKTSK